MAAAAVQAQPAPTAAARVDLDFDYYASLPDSAIMDALGRFIGIDHPKWSPKALFQARAELPNDAQDAPRHVNNPLFDEVGGDKEAKWVVDLDPVWTRITRVTSSGSPRPDTASSQPAEPPSSPTSSPRSSASVYDSWYRSQADAEQGEGGSASMPSSPVASRAIFTPEGKVNWPAFVEVD